jgi:DinB superfamily
MDCTLAVAMKQQLTQLRNVVTQLSSAEFQRKSVYMSGATIGQHTRHIIELLQCLLNGYEKSIVNYDERKRDYLLETDVDVVIAVLSELNEAIHKADKNLVLKVAYYGDNNSTSELRTTYNRELAYNLEHTIHHLALMKTAFIEFGIVNYGEDFGVAYATIQYRKACAQ